MIRIIVHNPVLGVPITFLNYHNPDEWEIIGVAAGNSWANYTELLKSIGFNPEIKYGGGLGTGVLNKKGLYPRILIKRK